eukprot:1161793-Pelagomonas_calceolata.AAC.2
MGAIAASCKSGLGMGAAKEKRQPGDGCSEGETAVWQRLRKKQCSKRELWVYSCCLQIRPGDECEKGAREAGLNARRPVCSSALLFYCTHAWMHNSSVLLHACLNA